MHSEALGSLGYELFNGKYNFHKQPTSFLKPPMKQDPSVNANSQVVATRVPEFHKNWMQKRCERFKANLEKGLVDMRAWWYAKYKNKMVEVSTIYIYRLVYLLIYYFSLFIRPA